MKVLWYAISAVLLLNALAIIGGVVWLYQDGRLNRERVDQVYAILKVRIAEEAAAAKAQNEEDEKAAKAAEQDAWLEDVRQGPSNVENRLAERLEGHELLLQEIRSLKEQRAALHRRLDQVGRIMEDRQKALDEQQARFEQQMKEQADRLASEDFKKAVALYQQSKPKQVKKMFMDLVKLGEQEQVVDYLAAMPTRKAAGILKEFKSDTEISLATQLVESLRRRGVDLPQTSSSKAGQANDS